MSPPRCLHDYAMPSPGQREITCAACSYSLTLGRATWGAPLRNASDAYAKRHGAREALAFERAIRAACGRVMR